MEEHRAAEGGCLLGGGWVLLRSMVALFQMVPMLRVVVWPHLEKCLYSWIVRRRVSEGLTSLSRTGILMFSCPTFNDSSVFSLFSEALVHIKIFFLPSPFSEPNQEPEVLEILLRDVCITNCPISQPLMAASGICTSVSVCHPANQVQQITMTEAKCPKQTLCYREDWRGLFFYYFKFAFSFKRFYSLCNYLLLIEERTSEVWHS